MTHGKVRQDFEAWANDNGYPIVKDDSFCEALRFAAKEGYQAGRAAERAEMRKKLKSEGMIETVADAICSVTIHKFNNDGKHLGKAAISKILEVI